MNVKTPKIQLLFTDGSVHPPSGIGYGAYLLVSNLDESIDLLKRKVKIKQFEGTSSTKLELQTLLWALEEISIKNDCIKIYTDSQNILSLLSRRDRLEQRNYRTKQNKLLRHYQLYQQFFQKISELNCSFTKVRGHQPAKQKNEIEQIFTLVDQASRRALRNKNTK